MSYEEMNEYGTYDAEPQPPRYEPKPKRKSTGFGKTVALALCCSLLGGAVGAVGSTLLRLPEAAVTHSTTILEGQRENTVIDIMKIDTTHLYISHPTFCYNSTI